jgi:hypothetical protein
LYIPNGGKSAEIKLARFQGMTDEPALPLRDEVNEILVLDLAHDLRAGILRCLFLTIGYAGALAIYQTLVSGDQIPEIRHLARENTS